VNISGCHQRENFRFPQSQILSRYQLWCSWGSGDVRIDNVKGRVVRNDIDEGDEDAATTAMRTPTTAPPL
jgi:hypothetical protein